MVKQAKGEEQWREIASLFRAYHHWLGLDLDFQGFEAELAGLPGKYGAPDGAAWLAFIEGQAVGCVAVRPFSQTVCEMKRLYVSPQARGRGFGRQLVQASLDFARQRYDRMVLDTVPALVSANGLYQSLGFRRCEPYYENPLPEVYYYSIDLR